MTRLICELYKNVSHNNNRYLWNYSKLYYQCTVCNRCPLSHCDNYKQQCVIRVGFTAQTSHI